MAIEAKDGADAILGVDLNVPGLWQGQVEDLKKTRIDEIIMGFCD